MGRGKRATGAIAREGRRGRIGGGKGCYWADEGSAAGGGCTLGASE